MSALSIVGAKWRREVPPSRRLTAREQSLPWAILSFPAHCCRVNRPDFAAGTPAATAVCSKDVKTGSCRAGPRLVIAARLVKKLREAGAAGTPVSASRLPPTAKRRRRDQARRYRIRLRQRSSLTQPTRPDDDVAADFPSHRATDFPRSRAAADRHNNRRGPAPTHNIRKILRSALPPTWLLRLIPPLGAFTR